MLASLKLPKATLSKEHNEFRLEVRSFLEEEIKKGSFHPSVDSWMGGYSIEFSRKLGEKGWIGMTLPKEYGGQERTSIERYVLIEELLAYGAPVAAHWFADRQTGPLLLKYRTESQKNRFLPKISKGECFFSIGLSEPNAGSDLASLKTRATKVEGGWLLNGSKIWSSGAHLSHYMLTLCRTEEQKENNKHAGLSQLIVDLSAEGVSIRPIKYLSGENHFNEVFFEDAFIPEDHLVGEEGNGWVQSMQELAFERSGPERILSTYPLIEEVYQDLLTNNDFEGMKKLVPIISELISLRQMSLSVAQLLEDGEDVNIAAAIVKDMGTRFEKNVAEEIRLIVNQKPSQFSSNQIARLISESILHSPGFTLRGGTTEILRGIIAKGMNK